MTIDLRHFRCFVAVAQELHFHRAAKALGVAQPALSRTIKNLEASLGVRLFERSNRRVELTEAGRSFLGGCREVLTKTQNIIEDVQRVHEGKIGTLRIGYTDNAMSGCAPALFRAFQAARPDISLVLTHAVTGQQLGLLREGALDFGFATGSVTPFGVEQFRIQRERFVCVVYDGHPLAEAQQVRLSDLAQEPMVQGTQPHWEHYHAQLAPLFRSAGFAPRIVQEGLTTSDIQRLVACGIGIAVLTETVIDTLAPGVKMIPLADVTATLDTTLVWNGPQDSSAKSAFLSFVKARLPEPALSKP